MPTLVPGAASGVLTNGELANAILTLRKSLNACNADKAAVREWAAALPKD